MMVGAASRGGGSSYRARSYAGGSAAFLFLSSMSKEPWKDVVRNAGDLVFKVL